MLLCEILGTIGGLGVGISFCAIHAGRFHLAMWAAALGLSLLYMAHMAVPPAVVEDDHDITVRLTEDPS